MNINETPNLNNLNTSIKPENMEVHTDYLLIDDYSSNISSFNRFFKGKGYKNFKAVECHTVDEALAVIAERLPKVLFLDHNLTDTSAGKGGEGLEIARVVRERFPDIIIYSTTSEVDVLPEYEEMGIKHVNKNKTSEIEAVIMG
jgi:CheY-like chemotaxis protein